MYKTTREEASKLLNLSTRSIDRYIKSWKLRSKKDWKLVYIHQDDIDNFLWNWASKQEIITSKEISIEKNISNEEKSILNNIYEDLKLQIKQKDEEIKILSLELWKTQEIIKNSISIIEFKKSQFLLEESKVSLSSQLDSIKKEIEEKDISLKQERKLNIFLITITIIIFVLLIVLWIIKI